MGDWLDGKEALHIHQKETFHPYYGSNTLNCAQCCAHHTHTHPQATLLPNTYSLTHLPHPYPHTYSRPPAAPTPCTIQGTLHPSTRTCPWPGILHGISKSTENNITSFSLFLLETSQPLLSQGFRYSKKVKEFQKNIPKALAFTR